MRGWKSPLGQCEMHPQERHPGAPLGTQQPGTGSCRGSREASPFWDRCLPFWACRQHTPGFSCKHSNCLGYSEIQQGAFGTRRGGACFPSRNAGAGAGQSPVRGFLSRFPVCFLEPPHSWSRTPKSTTYQPLCLQSAGRGHQSSPSPPAEEPRHKPRGPEVTPSC